MITHVKTELPAGEAIVFARLGDVSCSICAPSGMDRDAVELFATEQLGSPIGGWEAVDKSKMGWGTPTPNPCNITEGRVHWFLLAGLQAAALGYETKK